MFPHSNHITAIAIAIAVAFALVYRRESNLSNSLLFSNCNIERIPFSSLPKYFPQTNGLVPNLFPKPIIITHPHHSRQSLFRSLVSLDNITNTMHDIDITLSSSNSYSERRRTVPLSTYISEFTSTTATATATATAKAKATANSSWYFFGETFSPPWTALLSSYNLPPCVSCSDSSSVALSFGLGGLLSGVSWHNHGPGFSESIVGAKHWLVYDYDAYPAGVPGFDPNLRTIDWIDRVLKSRINTADKSFFQCTVNEGELIYFPHNWWHATLNLDNYTSFVSSFTTEHK